MTCKFFAQGENSSFCANDKPFIKSYSDYVYYNFSCPKWEEGIHQSRIDYMKNQYIEALDKLNNIQTK